MNTPSSHLIRGVLLTLVGGISWGFSGACGQYLIGHYNISPSWLASVRMVYAGLFLFLYGFFAQRPAMLRLFTSRRDMLQVLAFAILGLLFCQYSYLAAISYSNAGTATVLQYLAPLFIMLTVCAASKRMPRPIESFCILLALAGTFLLATHGNLHALVITPEALFWGVLSAIATVFYSLLPCQVIQKYGSIPVTAYGMILGGLSLCFAERPWQMPAALDFHGYLALASMVVIGTIIAFTLFLQGVHDIGPVTASMLASSEPLSATLFTVAWLGTLLTPLDLLGFALILLTVFLLSIRELRKKSTAKIPDTAYEN